MLQFYHKSDNQVNKWHSEVFIDNNPFEMSSDVFSVLLLNNLEKKKKVWRTTLMWLQFKVSNIVICFHMTVLPLNRVVKASLNIIVYWCAAVFNRAVCIALPYFLIKAKTILILFSMYSNVAVSAWLSKLNAPLT